MDKFKNVSIGKLDSAGLELKNGDEIIIEVCKPDSFNRAGIYHKGKIVYRDTAFCIRISELIFTPLVNYAYNCKITKIN